MNDRGFRPWLVALVVCIGVAVALVIWVNTSGGYANPSWFLSIGVGVGATLACLWLVSRALVGWRWVQEDAPPGEEGLTIEESVGAYQGFLANPHTLHRSVVPVLREAVRVRLRQGHAVDLDDPADLERVRALVPQPLLAIIRDEQPLSRRELPAVLDAVDTLVRRPSDPSTAKVNP